MSYTHTVIYCWGTRKQSALVFSINYICYQSFVTIWNDSFFLSLTYSMWRAVITTKWNLYMSKCYLPVGSCDLLLVWSIYFTKYSPCIKEWYSYFTIARNMTLWVCSPSFTHKYDNILPAFQNVIYTKSNLQPDHRMMALYRTLLSSSFQVSYRLLLLWIIQCQS